MRGECAHAFERRRDTQGRDKDAKVSGNRGLQCESPDDEFIKRQSLFTDEFGADEGASGDAGVDRAELAVLGGLTEK